MYRDQIDAYIDSKKEEMLQDQEQHQECNQGEQRIPVEFK